MERYAGKVAIVTGASVGIGAAIAETLTNAGMKVVGLARRAPLIQTLSDKLKNANSKGQLFAVQCDLLKEDDILKAFEWTTKNVGNVQVLINNAAIATKSSLSEGKTDDWRKVLDVNVLALCIATREAIKIMKTNKIEGHIIHLNSIAGLSQMYTPGIGVYGASKHAVTNLTEMLRREMVEQKTNVKVTSLSPGRVLSEMLTTVKYKSQKNIEFVDYEPLEVQDIADGVLYILGVPRRVQINELTIQPINSPR